MKIRKGFVSNSSTSSFVCDICHRQFAGQDLTLSDIDHFQCKNGHIVCNEEVLSLKQMMLFEGMEPQIVEDFSNEEDYEVDPMFCPICQFKFVKQCDILRYFYKSQYSQLEDLLPKLKKRFVTYENFQAWLNE